jgi:hypothetical protein
MDLREHHQREIDNICELDPDLKTPKILLQLGAALINAKKDLGRDYDLLRNELECLRQIRDRSQVTVDKDTRIMEFAAIKVCWIYHAQIPSLGWSVCRQISCLCPNGDETLLTNLFKTGTIRPSMRREQLDALRSLMRDKPIASRH